jgi:hypothetical protein
MSIRLSSLDDLVAIGYICETSLVQTEYEYLHRYAVGCNELEVCRILTAINPKCFPFVPH